MAGSPKDRDADRDRLELDDDRAGIDRRTFLQQGGRAALGIGAFGVAYAAQAASLPAGAPTIQKYVPLGKTGLMISDIGFGSSGCPSADIVRHCYDRGMNYFDTAEGYGTEGWNEGGYVENFLGEALHDKRDKVVITTKYFAEAKDDRKLIMSKLEESLQRLRTDHVDIYLNHSVNDLDRLKNPEWFEFVELAKKQGKIRFSGMSGHGGQLQECVEYAIDNDLVDVILCSHNFGSDPKFYERFTKKFDIRLGGQPGGDSPSVQEGPRQGHRRDRDEDADGRQAQRPIRLRGRGGGPPGSFAALGLVGSERRRRDHFDDEHGSCGQLHPGFGQARCAVERRSRPRAIRSQQQHRLLPAGLFELRVRMSVRGSNRRRAAAADVREALRQPAARSHRLCGARAGRIGVSGLQR
ncbi:MAG: aldo/keto reductase [Deltaproteobacteria bacterium]|nr:aldo/keto reductase [Deltaproteobacteria bacterium]